MMKMRTLLCISCVVISTTVCFGQRIFGRLSQLANVPVTLIGFEGLNVYEIGNTRTDAEGKFELIYGARDIGVGILRSVDEKPFIVLLSGEDVELAGEALSELSTMRIVAGKENRLFEQYAREYPLREQAISAWDYLARLYASDTMFSQNVVPVKSINLERQRLREEDRRFLENLPTGSYVKWFLPVRKLVSSVSVVAQYRPEEIPVSLNAFRTLDYADTRLYKSGLFKEAIESHFWLIENSGRSLDSVYAEMQVSIDRLIKNLEKDETKFNEVVNYLFELLERHSLFSASEYLAIRVLQQGSCTVNADLAKQLETYRAMKRGNVAPDVVLEGEVLAPGFPLEAKPTRVSDFKSKYVVVAFGASWCPKCTEELPEIARHYAKWKSHGVEVLYVSLDEDKEAFMSFAGSFPFTSVCDFKKWEGRFVEDYYVFATPTLYLLGSDRRILLRPHSVKQLDAWVDWYLIQGNLQN